MGRSTDRIGEQSTLTFSLDNDIVHRPIEQSPLLLSQRLARQNLVAVVEAALRRPVEVDGTGAELVTVEVTADPPTALSAATLANRPGIPAQNLDRFHNLHTETSFELAVR